MSSSMWNSRSSLVHLKCFAELSLEWYPRCVRLGTTWLMRCRSRRSTPGLCHGSPTRTAFKFHLNTGCLCPNDQLLCNLQFCQIGLSKFSFCALKQCWKHFMGPCSIPLIRCFPVPDDVTPGRGSPSRTARGCSRGFFARWQRKYPSTETTNTNPRREPLFSRIPSLWGRCGEKIKIFSRWCNTGNESNDFIKIRYFPGEGTPVRKNYKIFSCPGGGNFINQGIQVVPKLFFRKIIAQLLTLINNSTTLFFSNPRLLNLLQS